MLSILCTIVSLVASWMIYKKMGREGWEGIIPMSPRRRVPRF